MADGDAHDADGRAVDGRGPELGVALLLMLFAAIVIADSLRVGTGWADDGPRSGTFPFYVGLLLLAASASVFVRALLRIGDAPGRFATRAQLAGVFAVGLPIAVYVALVAGIGISLASAALITWFMVRHGRYRWTLTLPVAIGVPLLVFVVFERWFLVPLPKGPLERALGF